MYNTAKGMKTATILDTESLSNPVNIEGFAVGILFTDAELDACDLQLLVSDSYGGTYSLLTFVNDAAASNAYVLPPEVFNAKWLAFNSVDAGTTDDAAQDEDTVLTLVLMDGFGHNEYLTGYWTDSVTIADSGTASTAVSIEKASAGLVTFPAGWDTQNAEFHVAPTFGGTYVPLNEFDGTPIALTAPVASSAHKIPSEVFYAPFLKVVSAVAQAGAVTLKLFLR